MGATVAVRLPSPACPMACTRGLTPPPTPDKPAYDHGGDRRGGRPTPSSTPPPTGSRSCSTSLGLRPGDHVAFCLENHPRYFEVAWGAHYAGLHLHRVLVAAHVGRARLHRRRLRRQGLRHVDVQGRPGRRDHRRHARRAAAPHARRHRRPATSATRTPSPRQPAEPLPDRREVDRHALLVGHDRPAEGREGAAARRAARRRDPASCCCSTRCCSASPATTVYLSPAPLYHSAPLRFNMSMQRIGGTSVIMEHFDPEEFLALVERYRVTAHAGRADDVHPHAEAARGGARPATTCRRCESVVHAAAPCPVDGEAPDDRVVGPDHPRVLRRHRGQRLRATPAAEDWLAHPGTVGQADPRHASTSSTTTARSCRPGEPGTIYFEGGGRLRVPQRRREDGRRRATQQGWSTLGDVGYLDDDGYLYLTDRKAFMIISGGVNIYPQEAENVLISHPKVVDVAVFGVPNEDFGEEVKAVVQPVDMADAGPELEQELIAFCRVAAGRREVPPLDRLPRRAPPPPDRQALQAPAQGRVLGGPRPEPDHLTGPAPPVEPPDGTSVRSGDSGPEPRALLRCRSAGRRARARQRGAVPDRIARRRRAPPASQAAPNPAWSASQPNASGPAIAPT